MPAPKKLDAKLIKAIAADLATGKTVRLVCARHGITRKTFYAWRKQGREEKRARSLHARFERAIEEAEAKAENELVQKVRDGVDIKGNPDWKSAAHLLAVRNPEEYAKRTITEHVIRQGVEGVLDQLLPLLSEGARTEVVDGLARLQGVDDEVAREDEA